MGLAGPKNKVKISNDPNNTAWSRNETNFGRKILASQGWKPGDYLGAKDAAHSAHYTAANASHIRVILKDDNLGLGAKPMSKLEPTGFDAFSGLLGRLNGRSEESIQKEQRKLEDVRLAAYAEGKWKGIRFVRGGLLVPNKLLQGEQKEDQEEGSDKEAKAAPAPTSKVEVESLKAPKTKGRKREAEGSDSDSSESERPAKKSKKEKKGKSADKKEKKTKKSKSENETESEKPERSSSKKSKKSKSTTEDTTADDKAERKRLKLEKKARKEEKRRKKEKSKQVASEGNSTATSSSSEEDSKKKASATTRVSVSEPVTRVATPVAIGRQVIRGRYMRQKKLATMDDKSLNEIFMIKSSS